VTETQPPRTPLFRPEAVEAHARGRGADDEGLELREGRTQWAFRVLLLVLVLALAAVLTVKVDETARGPLHAAGATATVDLPVAALPRLRAGQQVRVGVVRGTVTTVGQPTARGDVAVVPVGTTLPSDVAGTATVRLNRRTLAQLLMGRGRG
jgi:hypothetical protein